MDIPRRGRCNQGSSISFKSPGECDVPFTDSSPAAHIGAHIRKAGNEADQGPWLLRPIPSANSLRKNRFILYYLIGLIPPIEQVVFVETCLPKRCFGDWWNS